MKLNTKITKENPFTYDSSIYHYFSRDPPRFCLLAYLYYYFLEEIAATNEDDEMSLAEKWRKKTFTSTRRVQGKEVEIGIFKIFKR